MTWKHPSSPVTKKFKEQRHAAKVMAIIFWDAKGVILLDILPQAAGCGKLVLSDGVSDRYHTSPTSDTALAKMSSIQQTILAVTPPISLLETAKEKTTSVMWQRHLFQMLLLLKKSKKPQRTILNQRKDSATLDTYFATSLRLDKSTGQWKYSNGDVVDMTSSRALILREYKSGTGPAQPTYDCALWNPWEPFFIPTLCSDDNAFVCRLPATVETVCKMKTDENLHFTERWDGPEQTKLGLTRDQCLDECTKFANVTLGEYPCWAAEYRANELRCRLLKSQEKPTAIPPASRASGVSVHYKNCKEMASFPEDTCSVLCKCNTSREIFVPQTEEEMQLFVQQAAAQAKRELYVPTKNLSSTTRKKNSATDERSSSTGMGVLVVITKFHDLPPGMGVLVVITKFHDLPPGMGVLVVITKLHALPPGMGVLGIVMFVLVFGSLVGLDLINVVWAVRGWLTAWKSPDSTVSFLVIDHGP
ncbi:transposase [Elysia marginata]|uniref:Transposase n=1 Tax=Elysia marginata TaxID=1093978 RepID=A0AAV4EIB9_9GAST|nr:transposase [Elysia marginata]